MSREYRNPEIIKLIREADGILQVLKTPMPAGDYDKMARKELVIEFNRVTLKIAGLILEECDREDFI